MEIVRLTVDATWYPGSMSTQLHTRVVHLDTQGGEDYLTELHDRRFELLVDGGDPVSVARDRILNSLKIWSRAIAQPRPF